MSAYPEALPAGPTDVYDAQPPLSGAERVMDTFTAPTKTFADLRRNRSWWLPFVLLVIFSYVFTAAALTHVGERNLAEGVIRNNPSQNERMQNASAEDRARTLNITAISIKVSLLAWPVMLLLFSALGALLLWMGFNFILGGSGTYAGMFAVMMFAWLPSIVRSVLSTVMMFLGDPETFNLNDPVGTNPGFYLGADTSVFIKTLLGSVDIVVLWILLLMAIGGAIVSRVKVKSGVVMVAVTWLIFALGKAAVMAAFS